MELLPDYSWRCTEDPLAKKKGAQNLSVLCSQACTLPQVLRQTKNYTLDRGIGQCCSRA